MEKLKNKYVVFFFMINFILPIHGQYLPQDNAKLNYNQLYFEYPKIPNVENYKLIIAYDSIQIKQDFIKFQVYSKQTSSNVVFIKDLIFGKKYKWYVQSILKDGTFLNSETHFFSLYDCPYTDTLKYKFKQYYNKKDEIEDGIIWLDHMHCAIDRDLKVVWFLPPILDDFREDKRITDFKVYNDKTISFIGETNAYHITKDLQIIWQTPNKIKISKEEIVNYHHALEKLNNGNYMVLGNRYLDSEKNCPKDSAGKNSMVTSLIEYNKNNEIVWSWKLLDYFPLDILTNPETDCIYNTHCNSFSVSKDGKKILLGFRDISRIIEIEKSSGKILRSFGRKLNKLDTLIYETDLFKFPHDSKYIDNDNIMVLNNNDVKNDSISSLICLKLPKNKNKNLTSTWDFKFNFDNYTSGKSFKLGNSLKLPNNNLLINEGVINRIVEIDPINKVPLWDLMIFKKFDNTSWAHFPIYRVYFSKAL